MSYNRSAVMKTAWAYARAEISASRFPMDRAAAMQSPRGAELCHAFTALNGKNRWSLADYHRSAELNATLHTEHRIAA